MNKTFISYAREDSPVAKRLYGDLKNEGVDAWLDQEKLLPGQNFEREIKATIRSSAYVIVLISEHSVNKQGFVQKEIRHALDVLEELPPDRIFIIPCRLDNSSPAHDRLRKLHRVDLFPSYEAGLSRILRSLRRNIKDSVPRDTVSVFVSYSWDSSSHMVWVRRFAGELMRNGIDVVLDQNDSNTGTDLFEFLETSVGEFDRILVICTPEYVRRANVVGTETMLTSSTVFDRGLDKEFIPIIRASEPDVQRLPDFMDALPYSDFRNNDAFDEEMQDLLLRLRRQPDVVPSVPFDISNGLRAFISQPFSSHNREEIFNIVASIAEDMALEVFYSHVPTRASAARTRIVRLIDKAHGFIAVWDDSDRTHKFFRPWRTFEFEAAQERGMPVLLFCHDTFRHLVARENPSFRVFYFSKEDLEERLKETFSKLLWMIERGKENR